MHSKTTYSVGLFAEFLARTYLRLYGFRIISSRYITGRHTNRAELDIIARRRNLLIFVEVKSRPTLTGGLTAVTTSQSARLRRAAETYMLRHGWAGDARFDIIVVSGWRIKWVRGAI